MSRCSVLLLSLGLVLSLRSRCAQARVRLNAIDADGYALAVNKSAWAPRAELTVSALLRV